MVSISAIDDTKLGRNEKLRAIKRLEVFVGEC